MRSARAYYSGPCSGIASIGLRAAFFPRGLLCLGGGAASAGVFAAGFQFAVFFVARDSLRAGGGFARQGDEVDHFAWK
jgi:hypothetical protein